MPRLSSCRVLWSTARLGVVSFLLVGSAAVASARTLSPDDPAASQNAMSASPSASAPMPGTSPSMPGMSGMPGMPGTPGDPTAAAGLTTQASGVKRSDVSSVVRLQALLYPDVVKVVRLDMTRIDYAGLNDFVAAIVDGGIGAVQSDDDYLVQLREYQKSAIKTSFTQLLTSVQTQVARKCYQNKIDDVYVVSYADAGMVILAFPVEGFSEADQKTVVDAAGQLNSFAVFNRYGFVVAVVECDGGRRVDADALKLKYRLRAAMEQNAAGGGGQFGATGPNGFSRDGQTNELGVSDALYREYQAELKNVDKIRAESRKQVLPFVRRRFANPATAENAAKFFDALKQADGAAISIVVGQDGLKTLADSAKKTPFQAPTDDPNAIVAGSFAPAENAVATTATPGLDWSEALGALGENSALKNAQTTTLAVSLVGSPRVVAIAAFDTAENANAAAAAFEKATQTLKPLASAWTADYAKKQGAENVDLSPMIDGLVAALKPQVAGTKVATTLDFGVVKENAAVALPLFGGVKAKTASEAEAEAIDWNLGAEDAAPAAAQPAANEAAPADEAKPAPAQAAPADEAQPAPAQTAPVDETKPADDEDPFA